jgi:hypothetical protein
MLPLEGIFFIPSLLVTPLALAVAYFWRQKWQSYSSVWWIAVVVCFLLVGVFAVQVLGTPLYTQRDQSPDNPGGFSTGITSVIGVYLLEICLVIPAFPVLIGLMFLPPHDLRTPARVLLIVLCLLYVGIVGWLILGRNAAFAADYQRAKQRERWQGDQFRHLRRL